MVPREKAPPSKGNADADYIPFRMTASTGVAIVSADGNSLTMVYSSPMFLENHVKNIPEKQSSYISLKYP